MELVKTSEALRINCSSYRLELFPGRQVSRLYLPGTHQTYFFHAGGDCNTVAKSDSVLSYGAWQIEQQDAQKIIISRTLGSPLWQNKTIYFVVRETAFEVYFHLEGQGEIEDIRFARGCENDLEWGWVGEFDEVFNPAPNFQEHLYYAPTDHFTISYGNDLTTDVGGYALASCCHCLGLRDRRDEKYLAVGVAANPGEYTWDDFEWNPPCQNHPTPFIGDWLLGGGFAIRYFGKKTVSTSWDTPRFIFTVADNRHQVLPQYLEHCYQYGFLPRPQPHEQPAWWDAPIYCTWHDQGSRAQGGNDYNFCKPAPTYRSVLNRDFVDECVNALLDHDCPIGTVILDDKWQLNLNDGTPNSDIFPQMREWIESYHARGLRVFLWTAAWNNDQLPLEQCITRDGQAVCGDITNPVYEQRFRKMCRVYFSDAPDCLNADGVKMDGLLCLPTGKGLKNYGNLWGLELQKRYLQVLFEESKKHKKSACISTFTAHPYLAEYCDMVRIADMYTPRLTSHQTMLYRAEVLRTVAPYALIDTDGQFSMYMLDNYADEVAEQAQIGIPCLYNGKYLRRHHFFMPAIYNELTDEDYAKIAQVLKSYNHRHGRC